MTYLHSANKTEGNWNQQLQAFVDSLNPSQDDEDIIKSLAKKIIKTLKDEQKQYTIVDWVIGGSLGKKTAVSRGVIGFDVDLVVMLKDITIDKFSDVLECFKKALEANDISCTIPKKKGVALQTKISNFDFDIIPAIFFSQNKKKQNKCVWKKMTENKITDRYRLSSSLVFSQLQFINNQSSFVLDVVRLCKFWNKKCTVDKHIYISGRSSLFELIAVDVANKVEKIPVDVKKIGVDVEKIAVDVEKIGVDVKKIGVDVGRIAVHGIKIAVDVKKIGVDVQEIAVEGMKIAVEGMKIAVDVKKIGVDAEEFAVDVKNIAAYVAKKVEKIAVDVAKKVEIPNEKPLYIAFRQFLETVKDFDNMNITFDVEEVKKYFSKVSESIQNEIVDIRNQRPLVLDPYNPFNNFANGIRLNENAREIFKTQASNDLNSLDELKDEVKLPSVKLDYATAIYGGAQSVESPQFHKQLIKSELDSIQIQFKKI